MTKMTADDLLSFLKAEQAAASSHASGQLAAEREQALRDYLRLPYGNEEEGRSQHVTSDVFDAIEGMLPDLLEVFVASDKAVVFDPVGPEDEEGAKQATEACNHVFYKQNNGFLTLYSALKDGLMMKTGGVKWYWETKRTPSFTSYSKVPEMQLALYLTMHPKAEVVEQDECEYSDEELAQYQGAEPPKCFDVKIKTVEEKGRVRVVPIPADELQVSRRHNSILLDECAYVAHVSEKTLSDIHEMGFEEVTEADLKAANENDTAVDRELRNTLNGGRWGWWKDDNATGAASRGWLREEYVLCDYDGDGIAERRRVLRLGTKILENKECSHVQIAAWTPYILTHRFEGISVADLVSDFQRVRTEIWRQSLDNLYLANNQETVVQTDSQGNPLANLDDLLNRRPGGIMRERVAGAIRPYSERWQGIEATPMLEQLEVAKENRTGWTRYSQGLDSNSLNKTAHGMQQIMNASQKRMKLMARIAAEVLVGPMFRGIFKTLTDYCMEKLSFRLRGQFVQYDPQEWRDGYDMTINVGIGTGDVMQQAQYLQQIAAAQFAVMQSPFGPTLVTPESVRAVQTRLAENAGFKNPDEFWPEPKPPQPQGPQQPPPEVIKAQMDAQAKQQGMQLDARKANQEFEHAQRMAAVEERKAGINLYVAQQKAQLDAQNVSLKQHQMAVNASFEVPQ